MATSVINSAAAHVRALNACNQRGRRMLSLVDLIEADTVNLPLAAYLAAMMRHGASLLVGARPGGAGKTAVMCALINFLPNTTVIRTLDSEAVFDRAARDVGYGKSCYLAHEIGSGYYYAYIWGAQVRAFADLASRGHCMASNLHTDTLDELHHQLCAQNGVPESHLHAITLKLFLRVQRGHGGLVQRRVAYVYENAGTEERLLWTWHAGEFVRQFPSTVVTLVQEQQYVTILSELLVQGTRRIEDVRGRLMREM